MATTVGELIEELQGFDLDTPVFIDAASAYVDEEIIPVALAYPGVIDAALEDDDDLFPDGRNPGRFCMLAPSS